MYIHYNKYQKHPRQNVVAILVIAAINIVVVASSLFRNNHDISHDIIDVTCRDFYRGCHPPMINAGSLPAFLPALFSLDIRCG